MQARIDHLMRWVRGERPGPFKVEIYPTNRCNMSCGFCWKRGAPEPEPGSEIGLHDVAPLVRQSAVMGTQEWFLCGGGEPLCAPHLSLPLMSMIKNYGLKGILNTNALAMTPAMIEHWGRIGWDDLHLSLDGPDEELNTELRGRRGALTRAVAGFRRLAEIRSRRGDHHPNLVLVTVLARQNLDRLIEMARLAGSCGVNKWIVKEMIPHPTAAELGLTDEQYALLPQRLEAARQASRDAGVTFEYQPCTERGLWPTPSPPADEASSEPSPAPDAETAAFHPLLRVPCYEFWLSLFLYPEGVAHCGIWSDNVPFRGRDLDQIWLGPYFQEIRRRLLAGETPDFCQGCGRYDSSDAAALRAGLEERLRREPP